MVVDQEKHEQDEQDVVQRVGKDPIVPCAFLNRSGSLNRVNR